MHDFDAEAPQLEAATATLGCRPELSTQAHLENAAVSLGGLTPLLVSISLNFSE